MITEATHLSQSYICDDRGIPDGYYAVLDPDDTSRMTYWRRSPGGLVTWPPKARVGPAMLLADAQAVPPAERSSWVRHFYSQTRWPWEARVTAAIQADPDLARARFATLTVRCCLCGRTLVDPASVVDAVGPDCRRTLTADTREKLRDAVGRAHAQALHQDAETTS